MGEAEAAEAGASDAATKESGVASAILSRWSRI